jgi:hypothetical protein
MDDNKRIFPPFTYFIKRRKENEKNTEIENGEFIFCPKRRKVRKRGMKMENLFSFSFEKN